MFRHTRKIANIYTSFARRCTQNVSEMPVEEKLVPALTGERGVNKVTLVGRVGRNPEVRGTEERPVTIVSLATSQSFKKIDGTYTQKTEWHRIAIFRPVLRDVVANTVLQGDQLYLTGSLSYSQYQGDNGPVKSASIIADDVIILSKKRNDLSMQG